MYMGALHVYICTPEEGVRFHYRSDSWELPREYWELNLGPLAKKNNYIKIIWEVNFTLGTYF